MTSRHRAPRRWRARLAVGLSAASLSAIPVILTTGSASADLPCSGMGGQGAGGYISSLAKSCETYVGTVVATPTPTP